MASGRRRLPSSTRTTSTSLALTSGAAMSANCSNMAIRLHNFSLNKKSLNVWRKVQSLSLDIFFKKLFTFRIRIDKLLFSIFCQVVCEVRPLEEGPLKEMWRQKLLKKKREKSMIFFSLIVPFFKGLLPSKLKCSFPPTKNGIPK